MAYSQSPQVQTYKTVALPFEKSVNYRSGDLTQQRDLQIVNMYYDRVSDENERKSNRLKKRPGLSASTYSLSKSVNTAPLRGYYYDVTQNAFYWAVDSYVYAITPDSSSSVRTVCTLNTSSGYVGFNAYEKSTGVRYVMFSDGTDLWLDNYASTSCTAVGHTDNFPTPHQPFPLYLDHYVFLIKSGTNQIWNSGVDDPTNWTAAVTDAPAYAEIKAGAAQALVKSKNYLVCLSDNSAEYFWDGGNPAPSTPLSRNDSPVRGVGFVTGMCTIGDSTFFVGQDEKQNLEVFELNNFRISAISTPVVNRTIQEFSTTDNTKANIYLNRNGYCVSVDGQNFYVLVTPQTTWVYNIMDKFWYEWKGSDGTGLKIEGVWQMKNGPTYVAIAGQSNFAILSQTVYQDFGSNFTCRYTTENTTWGTFMWKVINRVALNCSKHIDGDYTNASNVTLTWSTDDWSSGSTKGPRYINVFSNSPFVSRLGRARNVSFRIEYADNYPFFADGLEVDLNVQGN